MVNIGRQWEDRLRIWSEQFEKHYFIRRTPLSLSCFTTMERLAFDDAVKGRFSPVPVGTKWGKKWEYGWFRTRVTIPEALAGERVVFTLGAGEEMLVWVNGAEAGAIDKHHKFITLSRAARAGDVYDVYAECYAGHGPRREGAGPVGFGEASVPEPPQAQAAVEESAFGVWNEAVFQAAMDYQVLYSLVRQLPEKSLRAMKIIEGLKRFTYTADFELPEEELTASVVEADRHLQPLLACKNGSTAPEYTIFGQSHLDLAWLWPVEETMRKTARTYSNQLALMEEYPEYRFLLCEPPILEYLKELYPSVYRRVREKTASGAFCPEGALWIECDTNIPSGESLIRQFVRGKRWFREELGVDSQMAWMPDTFGFSAALPQIMKKCQIPYFATQKLTRQDPEAEPFPYNVFWWEGMDGSRVLSHLFRRNNAALTSGELVTRWETDRVQQENIDGFMFPFGYGDGGGGPTREMVETARRCADLEGTPRCRMESPAAFFERVRRQEVENVWNGELYLAWHRGTLTSQARTKRGIRKAEVTLKAVEYAMSRRMLRGETVTEAQKDALDGLWKLLLFNQFHDIAPGTSIARVHERAEAELQAVCAGGEKLLAELLGEPGEQAAVYNHLGWARTFRGCEIPAQGCAVIGPERKGNPEQRATARYVETETGGYYELRNGHLVCRVDAAGELVSVRKPGESHEFLAGGGNRFLLYKDVNTCYDAWELGSMYERLPVPLEGAARIEISGDADGAALVVEKTLCRSRLSQRIFLGNSAKRLDFITRLDWRERHKILKVAFPVNVYTTEAIEEIQFGYVKRPTHRSRQSDRDRYEVCNHRYTALQDGASGAAVLNDCKYGVSAVGNEIRLTLLKAPLMPDMTADQGEQEFTYSFYPFTGPFTESGVLREACELNEPPVLGAVFSGDGGAASGPVFLPMQKNIVVDTIKPADTVANALLVRAYEAMGMGTDASFAVSEAVKQISEVDMLEENGTDLPLGKPVNTRFGAFEIKSFLLYL
ncbi:MAG: alpha-mannosidase [Oscillospiraceae bacterium]|nr:alpha-mannosidase [Oscillospiraceae bacterium]